MITSIYFPSFTASNVTVHVHLMLLLLSRRLTEDIPREEWVLLVLRHGPGLSGVSEHHFTAGRRGLSLLAGIDQYLQFKLLVAQWSIYNSFQEAVTRTTKASFRCWKNFKPMNSTTFVLFDKYCPIVDQLGSKDSSRDFQVNCLISYFFYLHLILHASG